MGEQLSIVDAFTDAAFGGNPAAVCRLGRPASDGWMQAVATEMNLSETAFVRPRDDGDHDLRWFTPTAEVDLCGHATLATAHVLGGSGRFHTRSGVLTCRPADDGAIEMDFPAIPVTPVPGPPDWAGALGLPASDVVAVHAAPRWTLVELATPAQVRRVEPDRAGILAITDHAVVVAAPGDRAGVDSVCRVFAPGVGIDEDPVTGAAHCVLAPWLASRTGRHTFTGHQASARGGVVGMRLDGTRVALRGHAVTVLDGVLRVPVRA